MKLNLGCGGDYREGYLNVDAFDSTVADKIMLAYNLNFKDNFFDEIYLSQLIEHLGIVGGIHCLSECFRVLKPGKKILIETPDIRKSFEKYLNGDREVRKNILPWIYGVDIPGMVHRFCYPDDLIEEILLNIGFTDIYKDFFEIDMYEPVLKISCKKPNKCEIDQIFSITRKKLLEKKIIDLNNQITSLEKHELIDFFSNKIKEYKKSKNLDELKKIIIYGAIRSPMITEIFLKKINSNLEIPKEFFEKQIGLLKILGELNSPSILMDTMMKTPNFIGKQEDLFSTVYEIGIKIIEKLTLDEKRDEVVKKLRLTSKTIAPQFKIDFFSLKLINLKSNRFFQIGAKEFILGNFKQAINYFKNSMLFNRGQFFSFWNLGRLYRLLKNDKEAKKYYKYTSELIENIDHENIENIKLFLKKEIRDCSLDKYSSPITSFSEL